jgi:hypothetical protein
MSTSVKQQELLATNADTPTSKKELLLEKHPNSLQEQANQLTSQSPSSPVKNAATLTPNFFLEKWQDWTNFYSGLQDEIYD